MIDQDQAIPILTREHGLEPFRVVVAHGGPGAAGEMGPVAQQLGELRGVLEPMQSATTVQGQVDELRRALETLAHPPVVLIGHSWGAWLSCLVAVSYPMLVGKIILIGTPAFEEKYVPQLRENRLKRLTDDERREFIYLADMLNRGGADASASLGRLGDLAAKTDTYDPIDIDVVNLPRPSVCDKAGEIYAGVWPAAARMRRAGDLLALTTRITCPVVAIHGDYDPTPLDSVAVPLSAALADFRMVVLQKCGHDPWRERHAVDRFYEVLEHELTSLEGSDA